MRLERKTHLICSLCLAMAVFCLTPNLSHAQIYVRGFVDTYHAMRIKDPQDYLSSRTRVRLETIAEGGDASIFASFNAIKNHIITSQTGFELREAYIQYTADSWDFRAGRQIIIWGKADGVEITDIISPKDYTEFLAQDYDDIRTPVDALKFHYLKNQMNVELVWVPIFQPAILPPDDSPWAFRADIPSNLEISYEDPIMPENRLKVSEIGGRIRLYLHGIDLSFSSMFAWDKSAVANRTLTTDEEGVDHLTIQPEYNRIAFIGFGFSMPYRSLVFRGESAFFGGKRFEPEELSGDLFEKNTINWLLGVDWYLGGEWTLSGQFADFFILDYEDTIANNQHEMLTTFSISKNLLRNTLTLSTSGYIGINEMDLFSRSSVDYALSDGLHLEAGVDVFVGDEGLFGQYKDNSEIWLKAKYSF